MGRVLSATGVRPGLQNGAAPRGRIASAGAVLALAAIALAACSSDHSPPPTDPALGPVTPMVSITTEQLVGKWGLGSFRNDADLARTTSEARRFCSNPYVITPGPQGGAMMYLADQSQPTELFVKASGGRVYIGPPGPAGTQKDRQVTSFQDGVLVAAWVDPTVAARYGTMVFVRCGDGGAANTASAAATTPAVTLPPVQ